MVSYLPWKLNIFQELFLFMEDIFFSVDLCITDPHSFFISTQISARILELVNGFHWIGTAPNQIRIVRIISGLGRTVVSFAVDDISLFIVVSRNH